MQAVTVLYHHENAVWWAESPDVPGFSAAADDLPAARELVARALDDVLGRGSYLVHESEAPAAGGVVAS